MTICSLAGLTLKARAQIKTKFTRVNAKLFRFTLPLSLNCKQTLVSRVSTVMRDATPAPVRRSLERAADVQVRLKLADKRA